MSIGIEDRLAAQEERDAADEARKRADEQNRLLNDRLDAITNLNNNLSENIGELLAKIDAMSQAAEHEGNTAVANLAEEARAASSKRAVELAARQKIQLKPNEMIRLKAGKPLSTAEQTKVFRELGAAKPVVDRPTVIRR